MGASADPTGTLTVVLRVPFDDFAGKFVFNCHMLFHEDHGMMAVVEVTEERARSSVGGRAP